MGRTLEELDSAANCKKSAQKVLEEPDLLYERHANRQLMWFIGYNLLKTLEKEK
jgi:hypothetical protein